jgi:hypothetical protein
MEICERCGHEYEEYTCHLCQETIVVCWCGGSEVCADCIRGHNESGSSADSAEV